jgi:hypothetical protein
MNCSVHPLKFLSVRKNFTKNCRSVEKRAAIFILLTNLLALGGGLPGKEDAS